MVTGNLLLQASLGAGSLPPGWEKGLAGSCVGERRSKLFFLILDVYDELLYCSDKMTNVEYILIIMHGDTCRIAKCHGSRQHICDA